ncbi:DUF4893 domain-containing protein [Sphingomonas sp. URHD0057]|uniref:DUF4893 domain-containing protein n=1 Tax=Sphingomonas sp. URHD0057 TaxID=1380389 RepID=UPI00055F9BE4|nr:DUF4893 domain-containing protein [Sphingomonas sp. URHD0057]
MRCSVLLAAILLPACSLIEQPATMIPRWTVAWREAAKPSDEKRLHDWRKTFVAALDAARKSGHSADIAREGALLDPDAALGPPPIPDGTYRCRVIKLGTKSPGMLDYVSYPAFTCVVRAERSLQSFTKTGGSQRIVGLIFPGDAMRQVLLGTLVLGDEERAMQYGQDETRDIAGYVERIGPSRWRLVMPQPHFESQLDVIELVPAG